MLERISVGLRGGRGGLGCGWKGVAWEGGWGEGLASSALEDGGHWLATLAPNDFFGEELRSFLSKELKGCTDRICYCLYLCVCEHRPRSHGNLE